MMIMGIWSYWLAGLASRLRIIHLSSLFVKDYPSFKLEDKLGYKGGGGSIDKYQHSYVRRVKKFMSEELIDVADPSDAFLLEIGELAGREKTLKEAEG